MSDSHYRNMLEKIIGGSEIVSLESKRGTELTGYKEAKGKKWATFEPDKMSRVIIWLKRE